MTDIDQTFDPLTNIPITHSELFSRVRLFTIVASQVIRYWAHWEAWDSSRFMVSLRWVLVLFRQCKDISSRDLVMREIISCGQIK